MVSPITIRIIVPDQKIDDDKLLDLFPKEDKLYKMYRIKVGDTTLNSFSDLDDKVIEPLKFKNRIQDAVSALLGNDSIICCATGKPDDYGLPVNDTDALFSVFLAAVDSRLPLMAGIPGKKVLGYETSNKLFGQLKAKVIPSGNDITFNSSFVMDSSNPNKLNALIKSVGKINKLRDKLSVLLAKLIRERETLDDDITTLEKAIAKKEKALDNINNQIDDLEAKLKLVGADKKTLQEKLDNLKKLSDQRLNQLLNLNKKLDDNREQQEKLAKKIAKLEQELSKNERILDKDIALINKFTKDAQTAADKIKELQDNAFSRRKDLNDLITAASSEKATIEYSIQEAAKEVIILEETIKHNLNEYEKVTKECEALEKDSLASLADLQQRKATKERLEKELKVDLNKRNSQQKRIRQIEFEMKFEKLDQSQLNINPVLSSKVTELTSGASSIKVPNLPSEASIDNEGMKILMEAIIVYADQITDITIGKSLKYEINSFTDFLKLPNLALQSLNLSHAALNDEEAEPLLTAIRDNPAKLRDLDLSANNLTATSSESLAEFLKKSTSIATLNLGWNRLGNEGLKTLSIGLKNNKSLHHLSLYSNEIGADGLSAWVNAISTHPNRTTLAHLPYHNPIKTNGILALKPIFLSNAINSFNLTDSQLDDDAIQKLCEILKQRSGSSKIELSLNSNNIGTTGLVALTELVKEQNKRQWFISLWGALSQPGVDYFTTFYKKVASTRISVPTQNVGLNASRLNKILPTMENAEITEIDLTGNPLGNAGLSHLCDYLKNNASFCKRLRSLRLHAIGKELSLDSLTQLLCSGLTPNLNSISLSGNALDDSQVIKIANALPTFIASRLSSIDLSGNSVTLNGLRALLNKINSSGCSIQFSFNGGSALSRNDAKIISTEFSPFLLKKLLSNYSYGEFCSTLKFILEDINIDKDGCLNLSSKSLNDDSINQLISKLSLPSAAVPLKTLNLGYNKITSQGLGSLIDYFISNSARIEQLKTLNLSGNPLEDAAKDRLLPLLKHAKSNLDAIHLDSTKMTSAGLNPLISYLNKSVKTLTFSGNKLQGIFMPASIANNNNNVINIIGLPRS